MNTAGLHPDPRSGDLFVDWTFEALFSLLNDVKIYKVRDLRDPDDNNALLSGYYVNSGDSQEIYLDVTSKDPLALILTHELTHILYCDKISEDEDLIRALETILWHKFTKGQKTILQGFIPKRISQKRPKPSADNFEFTLSGGKRPR